MMQQQRVAPKYIVKTYQIQPGQSIREDFMAYGVSLDYLDPYFAITQLYVVFDEGTPLSITYLPIIMPFSKFVLENKSQYTVNIGLTFILDPSVQLIGEGVKAALARYTQEITYSTTFNVVGSPLTSSGYTASNWFTSNPIYIGNRTSCKVTVTAPCTNTTYISILDQNGNTVYSGKLVGCSTKVYEFEPTSSVISFDILVAGSNTKTYQVPVSLTCQ